MSSMPSILITDPIALSGEQLLRQHACVTVCSGLAPDALAERLPGFDGLIVRSATRVTARVVAAGSTLKIIGRAGVGVDNIDLEAATRHGIVVVNTPVGNANAAAEHTIGLLLALARHVPQATAATRAGLWPRHGLLGDEIAGKVLGVLGLGRIGRLVTQKARGLGMQVLACDPYVTPETAHALGIALLSMSAVLRQADYLTLHLPATSATHHLLNRDTLAQMRPGARLLNCARGDLIDEAALYEALESGHVAGAALDVLTQEPPAPDHPLLHLPHVICTPHLGAQTQQAQERVSLEIARQFIDFFRTGRITHAVHARPEGAPRTMPQVA